MRAAWRRKLWFALATGSAIALTTLWMQVPASSQPPTRFRGGINSQPLALSADDSLLAVCNPDNNTVSLFDVSGDANRRLAEVPVGQEPNGVALLPDGSRAYVANTVSGTVSVISVNRNGRPRVVTNIPVGTEPYGIIVSPNGTKVYVSNKSSNTVSVIDPRTNRVTNTVGGVGFHPRGLAMTNDGDGDDADETVFVSNFFSVPVFSRLDGEDDSKIGNVFFFDVRDERGGRGIQVRPMADSGFKAAGDAIARVAPPATITEADLRFNTGAYPNQMNNLAIKGRFVYLPSTGASPNGPTRFDVNTQSLLSVLEFGNEFRDTGRTINMHRAVADQTARPRLFVTQPWAMAFKNNADEALVISMASDVVFKVRVNAQNGQPSVVTDPGDGNRVVQIKTGKNPRGVVISSNDGRAYVMNYVSRDVTALDLTSDTVLATFRSAALPEPGSPEEIIHIGKELYHSSVGEFDGQTPDAPKIVGRMSNNGWGSCGACHPDGLTDNVVWIFASGPRRTVAQHQDYSPDDPADQRAFNWSGIFDEQEDFELNIRNVSGGAGLLVQEDGVTPDNPVAAFTPPNSNRRQLKVRGINAWDAIKSYLQFGVRAPISPVAKTDADVIAGEAAFREAKCQTCHGGVKWTSSRIGSPVGTDQITNTQIAAQLRRVGTFNAQTRNEVRANGAAPLGADGFVPPSLLSLFAFPQTFFHNGSAETLETVMANVQHRSAGTNGTDTLADTQKRARLVRFLLSIDARTVPIEPNE
jgi:YVTN family beta-propeller protein